MAPLCLISPPPLETPRDATGINYLISCQSAKDYNFPLINYHFSVFPQVLEFEDAGLSSRMVESPGQFFTKLVIKVLPL